MKDPNSTFSFKFYASPHIRELSPKFGIVKNPEASYITVTGTDFVCPEPTCSDLKVVMGDDESDRIHIPAQLIDGSTVKFLVPKYTKPEVLRVELTLNGKDYTNDNKTYGFFDPYVLDVQPRLIHPDGST